MKNFLVFGYGSIAKKHINIIKKKVLKSKFYIIRKSKSNPLIKNLKFIKNLNSIKKTNFYAVLICSPTSNHFKNMRQISGLVNLIFIEKPLVNNIREFTKICKISLKKKNIIIVGYVFRFNEAFKFVEKEIKKKKYGKVLNIESNYSSYLPTWRKKNYKKTVSYNKKLGGGVTNELSHDLDILVKLFGKIRLKDVKSFNNSDLKSKVEERIFCFAEIKKKTPVFIKLSFNEKILNRHLFINFSKGSIFWDIISQKVQINYFKNKKDIKKNFLFKNSNSKMFENQMDFLLSSKNKMYNNKFLNKEFETLKLIHEIKKKIK